MINASLKRAAAAAWGNAGAPGRTRTCDLLLRRQLLYPAELRAPDNASTFDTAVSDERLRAGYACGSSRSTTSSAALSRGRYRNLPDAAGQRPLPSCRTHSHEFKSAEFAGNFQRLLCRRTQRPLHPTAKMNIGSPPPAAPKRQHKPMGLSVTEAGHRKRQRRRPSTKPHRVAARKSPCVVHQ